MNYKDILNVPETDLGLLCNQVSQQLSLHTDTMLQFSPTQIREFIENGMGILIPHPKHPMELAGFAKLYQWPGYNQQGKVLYEFGSWVVPGKFQGEGFGKDVMSEIVKLGKQLKPDCQIVGVIEHTNSKAITIVTEAGGSILSQIDWPINLKVMLGEGHAQVEVIDVTNI